MKKQLKVKVCSRCKKELSLKDFKHENREAIFGKFLWIYPWCNDCSLEVKTKWGINWIGGTKRAGQNQHKKENTTTISSKSRRRSNKKVHIQRVKGTVSRRGTEQHKFSKPIPRRADVLSNKRRSGRVIKTLKKTKDYKGSI